MLHLIRNQYREWEFINPLAEVRKPVEMGWMREIAFVSKEDAFDAARSMGYWIDNEVAREH